MTTQLEILQWVTDTLAIECDIYVESPTEQLFGGKYDLDSIALVSFLLAVEEYFDTSMELTEFDREKWATPVLIAEELSRAVAR